MTRTHLGLNAAVIVACAAALCVSAALWGVVEVGAVPSGPVTPQSSSQEVVFTDVAPAAGVDFKHSVPVDLQFGTGAAWFDYDRDGNIDLYVTQRVGPNRLYRNLGDGHFGDVAELLDAQDAAHDGAGVAIADFDNDGWRDIYLANMGDDVLLRNRGGQSFVDVTAQVGLAGEGGRGESAAWGDYDGDGFLDLYVANHRYAHGANVDNRDRLLHNNAGESFTDVSGLLGTPNLEGYGFIGAWTDYDGDGDLDIFLVNDCPYGPLPIRVFRNEGGTDPLQWMFSEVSEALGVDNCAAGMGIAIGDVDRDGSFDYFHTSVGRPFLLRNQFGRFSDMTFSSGIFRRGKYTASGDYRLTWGANFFDVDLDGWLDLYVCSGAMSPGDGVHENLLFRNRGDGTFADVTDACGASDSGRSRTSVVGDYDRDGDLDLFVVNYGGSARLYRNDTGTGNHYLTIELEGVVSNRDGVGAKVSIVSPGGVQYSEVHSGTSLGGGDDLAVHFGLGADTAVGELRVVWPSGIEQVAYDISADQRLHVREPNRPTEPAPPPAARLDQNVPNPFNPSTLIRYELAEPSHVELRIYDVRGAQVRELYAGYQDAGPYEARWDGTTDRGERAPSGTYFYRLTMGSTSISRKMIYLR